MLVALIIGHKQEAQGASNSTGMTEFIFNEILVTMIHTYLRGSGVEAPVVYRDTYKGLPAKINALNPDYIISFHANAFNGAVSGTETLYFDGSKEGKKLATVLQYAMVDALGLPDRGIKSRDEEDKGGYILRNTIAPCVILESFFIDNFTDSRIAENNMEVLAMNIGDVIKDL